MLHIIFTGLVIAVALATTWFAGYVVYRLLKRTA
ncbi:hypothetical protein ATL40_0424 [Serinibacter salmoneus]|uniref:Uncharacterized protein n=1 Tax=Serinibacter salmoneus TaxID=556530 RepID=A0A2A9CWR7_9MICO|nr:hypothetical protein ATL40_0424 [Serinibacter salmoneus]